MYIDILNKSTGDVQFTADIDCKENASEGFKIGLAVHWAIENYVSLEGAKLNGAYLTRADISEEDLTGAHLNGAYFNGANLRYTILTGAKLRGANFIGADLTSTIMSGADCTGANFSRANFTNTNVIDATLTRANFTETNFRLSYLSWAKYNGANFRGVKFKGVPVIKNIHQKVYEAASKPDALNMLAWHSCETTHCRAGWVIELGGSQAKELERRTTTAFAAALIYFKSDPSMTSLPNFYDVEQAALEDMKLLADNESRGE